MASQENDLNDIKMNDLELFPYKSEQKINIYKSYPQKFHSSIKPPNNKYIHSKYYYNQNKKFLKNKRKNKRNKNEMPETPHNTGQYLSHIHQVLEPKRKNSLDEKDTEDFALKEISCFDDDDEDLGEFDFDFISDKKRDRLMSMEDKDLKDFLFKPNDNENEDNNKLSKSDLNLNLQEIKEENDLDLKNNRSSNL